MSQTAAHRVDHVIPHVPVRQWVLSLPIPLLLASQPELAGVYRSDAEGMAEFIEAAAPTEEELHALLHTVQRCPRCGAGGVKIIAAILERAVIGKILAHVGLDPRPPPRRKAREAEYEFAA